MIRNCAVGVVASAALTLGTAMGQTVTAVPSVDLNRFTGSWYEIARLPDKREKGCIADVVYLIAPGDKQNQLQLVNSCKAKNDYTDTFSASIKAEKNSGGGKLRVVYLWPFSNKDWILALGDDYAWVLIGSPNHKALRVLSRTRQLSLEVLTGIRQTATSEGFATDKLTMTLQTGRSPKPEANAAKPGE